MQRLLGEALAGGCRIENVDADLVGVIRWIVAHRMAGTAMPAGEDKTGGQSRAGSTLDDPVHDRMARIRAAGSNPPSGRPIMTPAHGREFSVRKGSGRVGKARPLSSIRVAVQASQVVFNQLAAAVDSLCDVPGFGQLGGAVMSRIGMVMIDAGSQTGKSYLGSFLVMPITVSL